MGGPLRAVMSRAENFPPLGGSGCGGIWARRDLAAITARNGATGDRQAEGQHTGGQERPRGKLSPADRGIQERPGGREQSRGDIREAGAPRAARAEAGQDAGRPRKGGHHGNHDAAARGRGALSRPEQKPGPGAELKSGIGKERP